ncbi:hypothetical protein [Rhizobium sp. BK251]|uniref:hypothetical protein n=1 Tax=Rhizobium sp. BK251 TaxID=2512125 RepID=UPI001052306B|nr:hypothetical protein [Rhizobium sp. BK251]TCL73633.1 hypothetical protein EV286_103165 [Rhizobium sp. BK251]
MKAASGTYIAAAVIAGLLGSTTMVQAQDPSNITKYGSAGGWDIFVRKDLGPGCLIAKVADNGMQVQMGIDETSGMRGYMAIYTTADAPIAQGEKLSVIFDVDGQQFSAEPSGQTFSVSLDGTDAAMQALRACQAAN